MRSLIGFPWEEKPCRNFLGMVVVLVVGGGGRNQAHRKRRRLCDNPVPLVNASPACHVDVQRSIGDDRHPGGPSDGRGGGGYNAKLKEEATSGLNAERVEIALQNLFHSCTAALKSHRFAKK